jgi:hypothetical protein
MRRRSLFVAGTFAFTSLAACGSPEQLNPLVEDPEAAGITIELVGCEHNQAIGTVDVEFEVTSDEEEYSTVLVNGEVRDESGAVLGTSSTNVTNVQPGRAFPGNMVVFASTPPEGAVECEVTFDVAKRG